MTRSAAPVAGARNGGSAAQVTVVRHPVKEVTRDLRVICHGHPEFYVKGEPCGRRVLARIPIDVELVGQHLREEMRVVLHDILEIFHPRLQPREVVRHRGGDSHVHGDRKEARERMAGSDEAPAEGSAACRFVVKSTFVPSLIFSRSGCGSGGVRD